MDTGVASIQQESCFNAPDQVAQTIVKPCFVSPKDCSFNSRYKSEQGAKSGGLIAPQLDALNPGAHGHNHSCRERPLMPTIRRLTITCDENGSLVHTEPKLSADRERALANAFMHHFSDAAQSGMSEVHDGYQPERQGRVSTKRKRIITSRASSPDTVKSCLSSSQDHLDESSDDSSTPGKSRNTDKSEMSVTIGDTDAVTHLLESLFMVVNQHACRTLAKALIKCIEPDKQAEHPYRREHRAAERVRDPQSGELLPPARTEEWSVWWPEKITYRGETIAMDFVEPDHLNKERRVGLLIYMLRLPENAPDYWHDICVKDELFTGKKTCSNWAEWLASKTNQLDLYDKNSRRTKYRDLNRSTAHSVQEAMAARRVMLDLVFQIVMAEEKSRKGDLSPAHVFRFTVPPIFLESFKKLEGHHSCQLANDVGGNDSANHANKRLSKKRVLTPPESSDEEPKCSIDRPCKMRDRLSSVVSNMSIQERQNTVLASRILGATDITAPSNEEFGNENEHQSLSDPPVAHETSHMAAFLTNVSTQEHQVSSTPVSTCVPNLHNQHDMPTPSLAGLRSDLVLSPSPRFYNNDIIMQPPVQWAPAQDGFYPTPHFSHGWPVMVALPPCPMTPVESPQMCQGLPDTAFGVAHGLWDQPRIPPMTTQMQYNGPYALEYYFTPQVSNAPPNCPPSAMVEFTT